MRYLRSALLGLLVLLLAILGALPATLAADDDRLSLTPAPDRPLATIGLRHSLPGHPGPAGQGQLASPPPACDKEVDLTSTVAGVIPVAAQDNSICTSSDIDTYVGQDGKTYVVQAGGQEAAWVHTDVSDPSSPVLVEVWVWNGKAGSNTYTPDVKVFSQAGKDYIVLALERLAQVAFCGVVIMDVTNPLDPILVDQFIGDDADFWCDVHNTFVENDSNGDGAFIYVTADNTQDLRVLDISNLAAITELGKYRRTARGFGITVFDDVYVHDVTVVAGKVYASYWLAGLDIFDASLIKVAAATVDENNPGVVTITPPLFSETPFLVHHAFPSGDGNQVFIEDEITFQTGFEPVQMWTTASSPVYVDGIELAGSGAADLPFLLPAHNLLVDGGRLYVGWYKAGLQVFDFDSTGFVGRPIYHQVQTEVSDEPYDGAWGVRLATIGATTYVFQSDRRHGLIVDATLDTLDTDGDGFSASVEAYVGTDPSLPCGNPTTTPPIYSQAWPADLESSGLSLNKVDIQDLTTYVIPLYRLNTSPGDPEFDPRWDVVPGSIAGDWINIQDLTFLALFEPVMFGGERAFNHPPCTP